ncbi:hypothetical protein LTR97_012547 [Elasticomyces elasticus]|uniref:Efficient mitochondria targeting-associated protein 19 n=1 Tax=Elasticomyces elasticus TaxID=574655 RepID=A0AAN7VYF1_9PEZI|nr:hypothetical protein LTR97_012547 [Elasticomyces elasticus]KAK5721901.1 hypothetical protein LTR15_006494 [Elasticomyces elasticus]
MASLFSRKRDLVYLLFFCIHIPVIFLVDTFPLWPTSLRPDFMQDIRTFYITTYQDRFFTQPPSWFMLYVWLELLYHVPLSLWAIGAILRDDPRLPIHLIVFATVTAITTSTCIADYMSWSSFTSTQKVELGKLYVPYLALSIFMGVDMYARLTSRLSRGLTTAEKKAI